MLREEQEWVVVWVNVIMNEIMDEALCLSPS